MTFKNDEEYKKTLDKLDRWCFCEDCEDGDRDSMDEIKLIHHESLEHIYQSEEAFIHIANYQCSECKLILEYEYNNGSITIDYDLDKWKYYDEVYEN